MRTWCVVVLLLAGVAKADVPIPAPPAMPDTSCVGAAEGAACGQGGHCRRVQVRRPSLVRGEVRWGFVDVMVCEGGQSVPFGAAFAMLAAIGAWWAWRRRSMNVAARS